MFSSTGLVTAGLIRRPSVFPGRVWAMLHENALRRWGEGNVNVVHYREVKGCYKQSPKLVCAPGKATKTNFLRARHIFHCSRMVLAGELASITGPVTTWRYWRRERFAHVVVATTEGEWEASVTPASEPPPLPQLPIRGVSVGPALFFNAARDSTPIFNAALDHRMLIIYPDWVRWTCLLSQVVLVCQGHDSLGSWEGSLRWQPGGTHYAL